MKEGVTIPSYYEQMNDSFLKSYLKDVKRLIASDKYTMAQRHKNISFMRANGLNLDDLKEVILALTPNNCISTCEDDRGGYPGYVYKFKSETLITEIKNIN